MSFDEKVARARRLLADQDASATPSFFPCDFGPEAMVAVDLIARDGLAIRPIVLDTGDLPPGTLASKAYVERHYGLPIEVVEGAALPQAGRRIPSPLAGWTAEDVQAYLAEHRVPWNDGSALVEEAA